MSKKNVANNGGGWIRKDKRLAIYLRDNLCCVYCGCEMEEGHEMTLDHVLAQSLGGDNSETNLVTCCRSCNSVKGSKSVKDFLAYLENKGIETAGIAKKVKTQTKKSLRKFRKLAKQIIKNRQK